MINPFGVSSNVAKKGPSFTSDSATRRLAVDNLIRRELKVGDPSDPLQIAQALMDRYKADPRARAIRQEAEGLPFLQASSLPLPVAAAPIGTNIDLAQAVSDVNLDLQDLTTNNLLKDVIPELQGWADAIRSAVTEGTNAARLGLDTRQRDKTFAIRRQLGDYARLARLIGALTPAVNYNYRNLAQSLDEVAAVLLVMMGESLANAGFAGGRYLLQAPHSELQTRRDAAIYALRNLIGATQQAYGPNDWPRGIDAYRRLYDVLEEQGQGDLRALLEENELARGMDDLVRRAAQGTEGLRALGSTAQVDLQRFNRLIAIGHRLVKPESPPLTSFLEALQLFVDAFAPARGFRLLRIARPPILFYGLYGSDEMEPADRRLTQLAILRGTLAAKLDCLMRCDCSPDTVKCQIVLDKVLYDLDRAIDLYAVGEDDLGAPEVRAAAYSYIIDAALKPNVGCANNQSYPRQTLAEIVRFLRPDDSFSESYWEVNHATFEQRRKENIPVETGRFTQLMVQELCTQERAEASWEQLARQMAPTCIPPSQIFGTSGLLYRLIAEAKRSVTDQVYGDPLDTSCGNFVPTIPAHFETSLGALVFNHGPQGEGRE